MRAYWMDFRAHLHSKRIMTWGYKIKIQQSPDFLFQIKMAEIFNKPPLSINSSLPAIVL